MGHVTRDLGRLAAGPMDLLQQGKALLQQGAAVAQGGSVMDTLNRGAALVSQGAKLTTAVVQTGQQIAQDPIPALIKRLRFRTTMTPLLDVTGTQIRDFLNSPTPPEGPAWRRAGKLLKPTLDLETITGNYSVAPFGRATDEDWKRFRMRGILIAVGSVLGLVGIGFLLGRASKRSKR